MQIINNTLIAVTTVEIKRHIVDFDNETVEIIDEKTIEVYTPFRIEQSFELSDNGNNFVVTSIIDAVAPSIFGIQRAIDESATHVNILRP